VGETTAPVPAITAIYVGGSSHSQNTADREPDVNRWVEQNRAVDPSEPRTVLTPRVRFTIRSMMMVVAVTALVALVASNPDRHNGITDKRVVIPVASAVAAVYGVWAMRRPVVSLLPLLAVWIATPTVDHPAPDLINSSARCCFLGWVIGAPAGWLTRGSAIVGESGPDTGSTGSSS
jgi:hypothetical protein